MHVEVMHDIQSIQECALHVHSVMPFSAAWRLTDANAIRH